jgi:glycosyltransferase involved in cell wall biosynthesis
VTTLDGSASGAAPIDVMHVITGLATGGAETMLAKLLTARRDPLLRPTVVSLMDHGTIGKALEAQGVRLITLGASRGAPSVALIRGLWKVIRKERPAVIQGWMYHGNIAAWTAWRLLHRKPALFWNVRHTPEPSHREARLTQVLIRAGAALSRQPRAIVYAGHASARRHEELGYTPERSVVVPNGFDCELFAPNASARAEVRHELGLPDDIPVIGMVARWHAVKDHPTLLRAVGLTVAQAIRDGRPIPRLVLVGRGADEHNDQLKALAAENGLTTQLHALGERRDIPRLTAALDVLVNSSLSEGFPNVVGEAMASGVPCIVTDVGESARIVGTAGIVVPPASPASIAQALDEFLRLDVPVRTRLGAAARRRVQSHFSIEKIVEVYESLYRAGAEGATSRALIDSISNGYAA